MHARRLLLAVSAVVFAGCNCSPGNPPADAGMTCTTAGDCGDPGNECLIATCVSSRCGAAPVSQGTLVSTQTMGDCLRNECNGQGSIVAVADPADVTSDNNECTLDTCGATGPAYVPADAGVSCGTGGMLQCNGQGACVGCLAATDCPGSDSECFARTCSDAGVCGADFTASGTALRTQANGDCQEAQCDGDGGVTSVALSTDVADDGQECTTDTCNGTTPTSSPVSAGTGCTQGGGTLCDGTGACVQCLASTDCSGSDSECAARACVNGACGVAFTDAGTPVSTQTPTDCKLNVCDGDGGTRVDADDSDLPVDGNECTADVCTAGTPSNVPVTVGTACGADGGMFCSGTAVCVQCLAASDCPGSDTECQARSCTNGTCGVSFTASGTALSTQTSGDCVTAVCDGAGGTTTQNADTDVPVDGQECTDDVCTNGTGSNPPVSAGTACTQGGGSVCSGAGACVECVAAAGCPGLDTDCQTRTCTANVCGFSFAAAGTPLTSQTAGDCQTAECDGMGGTTSSTNDADLPVDGIQCTADVCTSGVPSNPPLGAGTACSQNGGTVCDGAGACVGCVSASACPGADTECQTRTCTTGVCGFSYADAGTALSSQTAGDCVDAVCNGSGGTTSAVNDTDLPVDGIECTDDVCTSGTPSNPPVNIDTSCTQDGGTYCDGAGACVECNGGTQCTSLVCTGNVCQAPTCTDGVRNDVETDVDCGGGTCGPCAPTQGCDAATDCQSGVCTSNVCGSPAVVSVFPAERATGIAPNVAISVTFTAAMKGSSLTLQGAPGPCTGAIQVSADDFTTCIAVTGLVLTSGDTVATVSPVALLASSARYRVRVTTAAQDAYNNPLAGDFTMVSGFFTAGALPGCGVVISQVYGGGGNSGATYTNDFIELKNQGVTPVSLNGWSVQYTSAGGTGTWSKTDLPNVTLPPGSYFLVQEAAGAGGTTPLPAPDAVGTIAMSGTAGKVALVNTTVSLTGGCPASASIVDLVGFGTTASCFEGSGPAPGLSNTTAAIRGGFSCGDDNVNATDFFTGFPTPRNSATPSFSCSTCGVQNETGNGPEADWCVLQFPTSINVAPSTATPVIYGRVYEAGVTPAAGPDPAVVAQVGYAPVGVDPTTQCGWQFFPTTYNLQVGNDDEYQATLTSPAYPGTYWYTFRVSLDNGATWTYGDLNGAGSLGGLDFSTAQLPVMTVQ